MRLPRRAQRALILLIITFSSFLPTCYAPLASQVGAVKVKPAEPEPVVKSRGKTGVDLDPVTVPTPDAEMMENIFRAEQFKYLVYRLQQARNDPRG